MFDDQSFQDIAVSIRRLRKKLRQIENLERLERELSREECRKVLSKESYREQLQELVKEQEISMVTLKTEIKDDDKIIENDVKNDPLLQNGDNDVDIIKFDEKKIEDAFDPQFFNHSLNGIDNGESLNGIDTGENLINGVHSFNGHHLDHHREVHHFQGGETGLSLGFDENGDITADSLHNDDFNGQTKVTLPVENDNSSDTSEQTKTRKPLPASLVFQNLQLKMKLFEGHHEDTCAIDLHGDYVISGGRDTSLKLWQATTQEELKSIGGHTATITGVKFLKDQKFTTYPNAVTSSYDCSLKLWDLETGTEKKSIYVYSPIICMDYSNGVIAVGTEGGKIEAYSVIDGKQIYTNKIYDNLASAVKILNNGCIACGSAHGLLKIVDPNKEVADSVIFELDPDHVRIKQAIESEQDVGEIKEMVLVTSKITCIECYGDTVIYGDEGFNIKAVDYKKAEVVKMRNNLKEFSPTEALYVARVRERDFLFCVGSDIDQGDGFTNVRSLPDFKYMGTIRDLNVNSGPITAFCLEDVNSKIRFITAGAQLRTWDQIEERKSRKRKSVDPDPPYVPCKFVCTYTVPRESEPETDSEGKSSSTESEGEGSSTKEHLETNPQNQSWCQIL